jgi:hypothetical protein
MVIGPAYSDDPPRLEYHPWKREGIEKRRALSRLALHHALLPRGVRLSSFILSY